MGMVSGVVLKQTVPGQDVVGQCEPAQDRSDLFEAADRELVQAPVSEAGIEAFGASSTLVDRFAMRAFHPGTPCGNAGLVSGRGRIGIALMFAGGGWAIDFDALVGCPFGIVILVEAAVDKMALRPSPVTPLDLLQHRSGQATVRADRLDLRVDDDLPAGGAGDLTIIGRPEAAIGHLHDACFRIGGGSAWVGLLLDPVLVCFSGPVAALTRPSRSRPACSWAPMTRRLLAF